MKYRLEKKRSGRVSIIINCPKCGKEGSLRARKSAYEVYHGGQTCRIGWTSDGYMELSRIYREARSTEQTRLRI